MTQKILLVSWTLPPEPTGSAVIIGNLAKQFHANEMVIVGERPNRRQDILWREDWPRLFYIALRWPAKWRGARWWRRLQLPFMLGRSLFLAIRHRCNNVVAVFPNEEFVLVGYLTALLTGCSFYPYFHNTWLENRKGRCRGLASWLQSLVFARADHVFVMSEGMLDLYRERYPGLKCSALVHSFNEEIPVFTPPPEPGSPLRLTICGNINESCKDATLRVCEAISRTPNSQLTFLTGTPRSYLSALGLLGNGIVCETVSPDVVVSRLSQSDIVVLPHGFTGGHTQEEYRTIFPTRTVEYLRSGRPILAHSPAGCYLTKFLREHDCALVVDEPDLRKLIEAIGHLRADAGLRSKFVANALRAAERFCGSSVAAVLRSQLQDNKNGSHRYPGYAARF
jgi:glycosyltransferase involved in cell wall biosynthesis